MGNAVLKEAARKTDSNSAISNGATPNHRTDATTTSEVDASAPVNKRLSKKAQSCTTSAKSVKTDADANKNAKQAHHQKRAHLISETRLLVRTPRMPSHR